MSAQSSSTAEMKDSKLYGLFLHELKDIYWAESHLADKLPKMSEKATSKKLSDALKNHKKETDNHKKRLEKVFESLGEEAKGITCEAMKGLLKEAEDILDDTDADTNVRDAGIIVACQKVEHYEIASYGALANLSKALGSSEATRLLEETLDEEKKADAILTEIAEEEVNKKAKKE
jgi:ferritin-like metal-binding protein YciE